MFRYTWYISITTCPNLYLDPSGPHFCTVDSTLVGSILDHCRSSMCGNYERKQGATHWGVPWAWWCKRKEPFHQSIDAQLLVHHPVPSCIILESLRSSWAVAELQWPPVWLLSPTKPPMWKMWGPPSVSITFHVKGFYFAFLVSRLRAFTLFGASLQTHLIFSLLSIVP